MGWPFWDISKVKMSLVHPLSLQGSHLGMTNLLPAPPARVQEASLSFHLRGVPDVAALLLLAPLVSTGAWAPAKPRDLHAAPSESAGEINADQTLPCSCFLGEQPNLHGEYSSFSSEPRPRSCCWASSAFIQLPSVPTVTPNPHPSYPQFWLIWQSQMCSSIQEEEEKEGGGSCFAQGHGGSMESQNGLG